jgi:hypothetical protein
LLAHVVRQPVVAEHWNTPQLVRLPALQVPSPSHVLAGVYVALLPLVPHTAFPQVCVLPAFWQAPAPSHMPVLPQLFVALSSWQLL